MSLTVPTTLGPSGGVLPSCIQVTLAGTVQANSTKTSPMTIGQTSSGSCFCGAARVLIGVSQSLIATSEALDSEADAPDPELAEVEYDHEAMAEAMAELMLAREEDDWLADEDPSDRY
jgi:hypothetical protein